ncbi:MAG: indolepyruvate ferredoxin oxidoreductase subunit alpha [Desulfovibrionaceae bacterium]|nr:indolepyruvate ferredoxin oxidoreductase subunit alpha [Desulfovibrionaceae bacterium]
MNKHPLLSEKTGEVQLLLGNEAIVRGALEAGIQMVTCYPGTPSSEVVDNFKRLEDCKRYKMEYSINEKVAMEVACGAALGGALSLVTMKHVGLNVAADPLFTTAYTGLPGGLVVLSADDPGCHSSQNEQDNRGYARIAHLPCFEPATAKEARDMTKAAFSLARELEQPVMLRTTTRISHMRGPVSLESLPEKTELVPFKRDPRRFVPLPAVARNRHVALLQIMEKAREAAEKSPFNIEKIQAKPVDLGIIASGVARDYLADALITGGFEDQVDIFELGFTWPLPQERLGKFLKNHSRVLVLEEGQAYLEKDLLALAHKIGANTVIEGKDETLTELGEYSHTLVLKRLATWLNKQIPLPAPKAYPNELPVRPPNLCPGCSHRSVYFAARKVFQDEVIYSSDIGCYTLGVVPPMRAADFLFCMGSSISGGSGLARTGQKVVAFIGDSTFFHSGLTGLANAIFNQHDLLLVVLDNGTTAMTGHQPNPGMIQESLGDNCTHLDLEAIVKAMGVSQVKSLNAYNVQALIKAFQELKEEKGVRVIIAKQPCVLYARRQLHKAQTHVATVVEQGEATLNCLKELACPAFYLKGNDLAIDESLCAGCMVCVQIAPKSFKAVKREGVKP